MTSVPVLPLSAHGITASAPVGTRGLPGSRREVWHLRSHFSHRNGLCLIIFNYSTIKEKNLVVKSSPPDKSNKYALLPYMAFIFIEIENGFL